MVQVFRNLAVYEQESLARRDETAPALHSIVDYFMDFGVNKDFKIVENAKIVDAHLHDNQSRLTVIYHGVAAFTFKLLESKSLTTMSTWEVIQKKDKEETRWDVSL